MSDTDHLNPDAVQPVEEPGSILAGLRAQFAEASLDETDVFEVEPAPGLGIKARYVPTERFDARAKTLANIRDRGAQATFAAIDTLIEACAEIVVFGEDGSWQPLRSLLDPDSDVHEPVRFEPALGEILAFPEKDRKEPRRLVRRLFKGNDHAIRRAAVDVSEWMESVGAKIREDFSGG